MGYAHLRNYYNEKHMSVAEFVDTHEKIPYDAIYMLPEHEIGFSIKLTLDMLRQYFIGEDGVFELYEDWEYDDGMGYHMDTLSFNVPFKQSLFDVFEANGYRW